VVISLVFRPKARNPAADCCRITSELQPELPRVAEVAVGETIEKTETGNAIEARRRRRYTDNAEVLIEPQRRESDSKIVNGKRAGVGTTKSNGKAGQPSAMEAIISARISSKGEPCEPAPVSASRVLGNA
jgi:hypothetical protein